MGLLDNGAPAGCSTEISGDPPVPLRMISKGFSSGSVLKILMMATRAPGAAVVKVTPNEAVAPGGQGCGTGTIQHEVSCSRPNDIPPEAGQCSKTRVLDGKGVGLAIPREKVSPLIIHPLIGRQGAVAVKNRDFLGIC